MCGIAGIFHVDEAGRSAERDVLLRMRVAQTHRGPDDEGIWQQGRIGMAHKRLSILDVERGVQPMVSKGTGNVICYNGEVFNYLELRKELMSQGLQFSTTSDTETVLTLYDRYGEDVTARINGQFAFSIWDARSQRLFLARDRLGIKPLYYFFNGGSFYWASEIKALLCVPDIPAVLNREAIHEYFLFRNIAGEQTMFRNIFEVPPGYWVLVDEHGIQLHQYWDTSFPEQEPDLSIEECAERIRVLIKKVVVDNLISDVPLGSMNSGGLDSTIVSTIAAGEMKDTLNTYSVGFSEPEFDESPYARIVADTLKTCHHSMQMSAKDYCDKLEDMIYFNDEPLHLYNSIAIFLVSQLAAKDVKVLISGEGSDEVFAGYGRYGIFPRAYEEAQHVTPAMARRMLAQGKYSGSRTDRYRLELIAQGRDELLLLAGSFYGKDMYEELVNVPKSGLAYRRSLLEQCHGNVVAKMLFYDQKVYLPALLQRQDRMCMAAGIESRVPLIDHQLVDYVNLHVPSGLKHNGTEKYILRYAFNGMVPDEILRRKKMGFPVPIEDWFENPTLLGKMLEVLDSPACLCQPLVNHKRVRQYVGMYRARKLTPVQRARMADFLFSLLNLEIWLKLFSVRID